MFLVNRLEGRRASAVSVISKRSNYGGQGGREGVKGEAREGSGANDPFRKLI